MNTRIWAIVPAAGIGARFGSDLPKQYHELAATPIIVRTLQRLGRVNRISGIGVGIAADDTVWPKISSGLSESIWSFVGGPTRLETISNGLKELINRDEGDGWVLIHDAVRPCVRIEDVDRLIDAVDFEPPGGLLASPVVDTVKSTDSTARVIQTVSRVNLWHAQTPQLFPVGLLQKAVTKAIDQQLECTDDAQAIEQLGLRPKIVACADHNFKITHQSDLVLAGLVLSQQDSNTCSG
ncbi:MAG TPA: 2-C-methyl-D-erythritol 4-phosphate cytidylyltransferase [Gammaproteobacteria bacterium]|nr:2-C-methyl-D-erythritol 4-phosphate cytidylyltransferase [Gammaproteobacteria bacterium]